MVATPTALVRRPTPDLVDGITTHIDRVPVDVDKALAQHEAYCAALAAHGWELHHVEQAPGCPDAVFVEDTVVVVEAGPPQQVLGSPQHERTRDFLSKVL